MLQSSGMGKSRSFKEVASNYLTFCVVFREKDENGFPSESKLLMSYLLFESRMDSIPNAAALLRYICFLKACTDIALAVALSDERKDPDFLKRFYFSQVNSDSDIFWTPILDIAKSYEAGFNISAKSESDLISLFAPFVYSKDFLSKLTVLSTTPLKVLFVLDEVHVLFMEKMKKLNEHLFVNFNRAFQIFDNFKGILCITADTASKFSFILPTQKDHISDRVSVQGDKLLPPFYRVGTIDCNVDSKVAPISLKTVTSKDGKTLTIENGTTLEAIMRRENIAKYGRPLWWSLLKSNYDLEELLRLAKRKLIGLNSSTQLSDPKSLSLSACLAVFGCRLQFAFRPSYEIAAELTSSHLGVVDFISKDRDILLMSYTSEPVVAEAAAMLMDPSGNILPAMLHRLEDYLRGNFIDSGVRSEYIARLVCVLAADQVAKQNEDLLNGFTFNKTIPCKEYLQELVGDDLDNIIRSQNQFTGDIYRFLQGKVFFTHFINCSYTPTLGDLVDFFKRGAAILCKNNQKGIDMIIPVLLPQTKT
jgi:hypothetical protein